MRRCARVAVLAALMIFFTAATSASAASPTLGSSPDWSTVDGAVPYKGGHAIPLKAAQPAWFTDALAARVDAANGAPVAAPPEAPLPGEVGIRPGSWMIAPAGCTMNFVFGSPGSYSIGTAGHCGAAGEAVTLLTLAPGGANPVLVELGTIQRSVDGGIGNDFAHRLDPARAPGVGQPDDRRRGRPLRLLRRIGPRARLPLRPRPRGRHRRHAARRPRAHVAGERLRVVRRCRAGRLRAAPCGSTPACRPPAT